MKHLAAIQQKSITSTNELLPTSPHPATHTHTKKKEHKEAERPPIEPIRLPTIEEIRGQDIWNNCAVRSVVSGVMGGGLGLFMGMFLGALDNPLMQEEMNAKQQFIYTAKQMGRRSWSSAKTFAVMGLIFSAAECVVEKVRAKHDMTNTVVAGCATGGVLSAKGNVFSHHSNLLPCKSRNQLAKSVRSLLQIPP